MKRKLLSLALALAVCLGLSVPAFAAEAGDACVSVTDSTGLTCSLNLSRPIFGTVTLETLGEENTFYQIPLGTVITPEIPGAAAPDGWIYNLPNGDFVSFMVSTRGGDDSGDGGCTWWPWTFLEDIPQPLKPGTYQVECRHGWSTDSPGPGADAAGMDGVTEYVYFQVVPVVTAQDIPAGGTAYASTQTVTVDGQSVEFQMYALLDENGNPTNYIKLRDLASVLNGTNAQFYLYWDGMIKLYPGGIYDPDGSEMSTPFSGDRAYAGGIQAVQVDEFTVSMTAITLYDDEGGGYNYFKLRDLGAALGFNVGWDGGAFIETDKPYTGQ